MNDFEYIFEVELELGEEGILVHHSEMHMSFLVWRRWGWRAWSSIENVEKTFATIKVLKHISPSPTTKKVKDSYLICANKGKMCNHPCINRKGLLNVYEKLKTKEAKLVKAFRSILRIDIVNVGGWIYWTVL